MTKNILKLVCILLLAISCKENKTSKENTASQEPVKNTDLSIEDLSITITFKEGLLKGTHTFYPEKGNYASQINIGLTDDISNLNASKIVTNKGIQLHYITRQFIGETKIGTHNAKKGTNGCGNLNFIDLKNTKNYNKINGNFSGCTTTSITQVSKWKSGTVYDKRIVAGSFTDTVVFDITMDDDSKKTETTEVTVNFIAKDLRRKI